MKHVTIKDIARSLCISVSTVSRALTDDKNIRKETRDMVVEEAKRLGYKRNPVAMNLKMGRTNWYRTLHHRLSPDYHHGAAIGGNGQKSCRTGDGEDQ